jgi:hypothetical protein
MKLMVKDMVRRAPPPGAFSKSEDEDGESTESEDGDGEAFMSSVRDFIGAVGGDVAKAEEAAGFLKEAIRYCK